MDTSVSLDDHFVEFLSVQVAGGRYARILSICLCKWGLDVVVESVGVGDS
ncbi:type II toxin-antitoxin system ParD family antitoxin [Trueperella pyogenes]